MAAIDNLIQKAVDLGKTESGGPQKAGNKSEAQLGDMFAAELAVTNGSANCSTGNCGSSACSPPCNG